MCKTVYYALLILLSLCNTLVTCAIAAGNPALAVTDPRCEYQSNPLGIDVAAPRLSWIMESKVRGMSPSAYRILVAQSMAALDADQGDLWDSGKVNGSLTVGKIPLRRRTSTGTIRLRSSVKSLRLTSLYYVRDSISAGWVITLLA